MGQMDRSVIYKRKVLVVVFILLALSVAWHFYDEPLLPETREWLKDPSPTNRDEGQIRLIDQLHNLGKISFSQVMPSGYCNTIGSKCADYVFSNKAQIKKRLPSNPDYWSIIEQTFDSIAIGNDPSRELDSAGSFSDYITAIRLYYIRELVERGRVTPETAIASLNAQRKFLAEAPFLFGKMVFLATTDIALNALWFSMSTTPADDPDFSRLLEAVRPLTKAERSLLTVFKSEFRLLQPIEAEIVSFSDIITSLLYPYRPNHTLNLFMRNYKHIAHQSELSAYEFWYLDATPTYESPTTWDRFINPAAVILSAISAPAYYDYIIVPHVLDMKTRLIGEWGEIHKKRKEHRSLPVSTTPHGWQWGWQDASLCLIAPDSAPWVDMVSDLCLPQIDASG